MTKNNEPQETPEHPTSNPSVDPESGSINPSAPTAGTEGWGTTTDERRVLSGNNPAATRAGQMKGNPGDDRTASTQQMERNKTGEQDGSEKEA